MGFVHLKNNNKISKQFFFSRVSEKGDSTALDTKTCGIQGRKLITEWKTFVLCLCICLANCICWPTGPQTPPVKWRIWNQCSLRSLCSQFSIQSLQVLLSLASSLILLISYSKSDMIRFVFQHGHYGCNVGNSLEGMRLGVIQVRGECSSTWGNWWGYDFMWGRQRWMELEDICAVKLSVCTFTDLDSVSEERRDVKVILRLLV